MDNKKIRDYHAELLGYLEMIEKSTYNSSSDPIIWQNINKIISSFPQEDYSQFMILPEDGINGKKFVKFEELKINLSGLTRKLESQFNIQRSNLNSPQNVNILTQHQQINISLMLEFQSKVDEILYTQKDLTEPEKNFLQKIKDALVNIKDYMSLLTFVITLAKDMNLNLEQLGKLFT